MATSLEMTPSQCPPRLQKTHDNDTDEPLPKRICTSPSPLLPLPLSEDTVQIHQPQPHRPLGSLLNKHTIACFANWLKDIPSAINFIEIVPPRRCSSEPTIMPRNGTLGSMGPPPAPSSAPPTWLPGYIQAPPTMASNVLSSVALSAQFSNFGLRTPTAASKKTSSAVDQQVYRYNNLEDCGIHYINPQDIGFVPAHVNAVLSLIKYSRANVQEIPSTPSQQLFRYYYAESEVEMFYSGRVFPAREGELLRSDRLPMSKHILPQSKTNFQLTNPIPDMMFGYDGRTTFSEGHKVQLRMIDESTAANSVSLMFPFLIVEFKGADGALWVAENQCLGGSAACVNTIERLIYKLGQHGKGPVPLVDNCVFSIAMNGELARLYVSWKTDEGRYYTTTITSYLLLEPDHYMLFKKHVRNILDWGKNRRLQQIRHALDSVQVRTQQQAAAEARSRPRPPRSVASSACSDRVVKRQDLGMDSLQAGPSTSDTALSHKTIVMLWQWDPAHFMYKRYEEHLGWVHWDGIRGAEMLWANRKWKPLL